MAEPQAQIPDDIGEGDVFFYCPVCGKSMVIDDRGAGLMVDCPSCKSEVLVPSESQYDPPASLRIDGEGEAAERIAALTKALKISQDDITKLSTNLAEVNKRRKFLEQQRAAGIKRLERIAEEMTVMQAAIDRIVEILRDSAEEPVDL